MIEGTVISGSSAPREALHEIHGTIESLSRLLDDMRVEHARQSEETDELREELTRMRDREEKLNGALIRLRHWLALDAEAMLSPNTSTRLAGLEAGAEQLREEAESSKRMASAAQQGQEHAEASLAQMRAQVESLTRQVAGVTKERDALKTRLAEHETMLQEAGLEIEFRSKKGRKSR